MDPTKVVVLGAGPGLGSRMIDALTSDGLVVELKTHHLPTDFEGDVILLPRRVPEERNWDCKRGKTGAARIKRNAKQRRRRKGK